VFGQSWQLSRWDRVDWEARQRRDRTCDGRGGLGYNEKSFAANIEVTTSEEEELCLNSCLLQSIKRSEALLYPTTEQ
jgi:hypothetical protein